MTQQATLTDYTPGTDANCDVCAGTGYDLDFGSPCGACAATTADPAAAREAAEAVAAAAAESARAHDAVLAHLATVADSGDDFARSLMRSHTARGLSPKQYAAAERMYQQAQSPEYRFTKTDAGEWAVYGPAGAEPGAQVTVTKADGTERTVWIIAALPEPIRGRTGYLMAWDDPSTPQPGDAAAVVTGPGMFTNDAGDMIRAQESRTGNLYAKVLTPGGKYEYAGKAPLTSPGIRPLTAEEAAAYGRAHVQCCVCGRELTKEESKKAGIGPICAGKI